MKSVCSQCHSRPFVDDEFAKGDDLTQAVNAKVTEAKDILEKLLNDDLHHTQAFRCPIKYTAFDLWHHYGRTAKFGGWMQGPDYAQWHGIYPLMSELAKLKEEAARLREKNAARGPDHRRRNRSREEHIMSGNASSGSQSSAD